MFLQEWVSDLYTSGKGVWRLAQDRMWATGLWSALPTAGADFRGAIARTQGSPDLWRLCGSTDGGTTYFWGYLPLVLFGSATWNPGALASGGDEGTTVTVTGAALGDMAVASLDSMTAAAGGRWAITANVNDTDTVVVRIVNYGASVNLASGTVRVYVFKKP